MSFAPLPTGDGVNAELIAIAKRFGSVRKSLFLPNRVLLHMWMLNINLCGNSDFRFMYNRKHNYHIMVI